MDYHELERERFYKGLINGILISIPIWTVIFFVLFYVF